MPTHCESIRGIGDIGMLYRPQLTLIGRVLASLREALYVNRHFKN